MQRGEGNQVFGGKGSKTVLVISVSHSLKCSRSFSALELQHGGHSFALLFLGAIRSWLRSGASFNGGRSDGNYFDTCVTFYAGLAILCIPWVWGGKGEAGNKPIFRSLSLNTLTQCLKAAKAVDVSAEVVVIAFILWLLGRLRAEPTGLFKSGMPCL